MDIFIHLFIMYMETEGWKLKHSYTLGTHPLSCSQQGTVLFVLFNPFKAKHQAPENLNYTITSALWAKNPLKAFTSCMDNGLLKNCALVLENLAWQNDNHGKKCKGQERKAIEIKDAKP